MSIEKDHTTVHPSCVNQAHRIDLHLWRGAPRNLDETRPITILVNDGYVVGFCPTRLQPAWSAYRVALAKDDVNFERPLTYYDDLRLDEAHRIGQRTFGKIGDVQLNVGHMTPNEVINRQFGRLAQLETFLMSNMSPQYGSLNKGVWYKLETAIREIRDERGKDHVWTIVGPVFGEHPASIHRGHGKDLPIPDAFFCVTVDPHTYPFDTPSKVEIDCFIIPQNAPRASNPDDFPATLAEVEEATNLEFFPSWGRELPIGSTAKVGEHGESRLMQVLGAKKPVWAAADGVVEEGRREVATVEELIQTLKDAAGRIQSQARLLHDEDLSRLRMIQHTISWLLRARDISHTPAKPKQPAKPEQQIITYYIASDMDERLKIGARTACNFWNRFIHPKYSIVIRLGTFTQRSKTIACAYEPCEKEAVQYGRVEFNTKYLAQFSANEIAGTIVHEIGHALGIGWEKWHALFDRLTGQFKPEAVQRLAALEQMKVELDGGSGTAFAHWDEQLFGRELMTGYKDCSEYVLPVTIDLMEMLGHTVRESLPVRTDLAELLQDAAGLVFSRQEEARRLNLDHFEDTDLFEEIPHVQRVDGTKPA